MDSDKVAKKFDKRKLRKLITNIRIKPLSRQDTANRALLGRNFAGEIKEPE